MPIMPKISLLRSDITNAQIRAIYQWTAARRQGFLCSNNIAQNYQSEIIMQQHSDKQRKKQPANDRTAEKGMFSPLRGDIKYIYKEVTKMKTKKKAALLTAAVLVMSTLSLPAGTASAADNVLQKVEFESGTLTDCEYRETLTWEQIDKDGFGNPCDMTGWSGDGYVYIDRANAAVTVTVDMAEEGYYGLNLCYIQCAGTADHPNKTQYLLVNDESQGEVLFPFNSGKGWQELPAGYVHLQKGKNTVTIKSYWGYTFFDYLTITEAPAYLTNFVVPKSWHRT